MSQALATTDSHDLTATHPGEDLEDFVTFFVDDQMFGIPVLNVQDILTPERIAVATWCLSMSPSAISGDQPQLGPSRNGGR